MTLSVCRAICRLSERFHRISISSRHLHEVTGARHVGRTGPSSSLTPDALIFHSSTPCVLASTNWSGHIARPATGPRTQSVQDVHRSWKSVYDCPSIPNQVQEVETPPSTNIITPLECPVTERPDMTGPGPEAPSKQARRIQKIRHEKMKKHQRKKFKKKHVAWLRKVRFQRARNKERRLVRHLAKFNTMAEEFDVKQLIRNNLALARGQGYRINILDAMPKSK